MRVSTWLAFCLALLLLLGCSPSPELPEGALRGKLVLTGSSTVAPLAAEIGRRFEETYPGTRVDVQTGGSSRGIADVRSGIAHLGMASRELADDESDLLAFPLARDGVGIIVHRDNPVAGLTGDQVRSIYTGEVGNWSEVGGPSAPIAVINKADGRATLDVFVEHFGLDPRSIRAHVVIGDNQQGLKTVIGDPWAIAYVSIGAAEYEIEAGASLRLLALDGIEPTSEVVASGRWPMTRPLNLVASSEPKGLTASFLEFARSEAVYDLVEAQLFAPVGPS